MFTTLLKTEYQPIIGRFTQRDTHWNTVNIIYGDEVKTKEYEDYLGLNTYTVKLVDYAAVRQSGNVYGYCLNNPLVFIDPNGEELFTVIGIGVAALFTVVLTGCSAQDRNEWVDNNAKTKLGYNFQINSYGYYGTASSGSYVRNISGGLDAAKAFFAQKTVGYVAEWNDGNALMREMDDGTIYTFREKSNSDGTAVVDIDTRKVFFEYGGKEWRIQFWKGDYGAVTGAEIGLYYKDIGSTGNKYDCVQDSDMLTMSLKLYDSNGIVFERETDKYWWCNSFKMNGGTPPEQLTVVGTITFKSKEMCNSFVDAYINNYDASEISVEDDGMTVTINWRG